LFYFSISKAKGEARALKIGQKNEKKKKKDETKVYTAISIDNSKQPKCKYSRKY